MFTLEAGLNEPRGLEAAAMEVDELTDSGAEHFQIQTIALWLR